MDTSTNEDDETEEEFLTLEISDEALEGAADSTEKSENYTFCYCTYTNMCRFW
jgi:hypothetical protein